MTIVDVDPDVYYAAGTACNTSATQLYTVHADVVSALRDCGGMAGTSDEGRQWAASYDSRVLDLLAALGDVIAALDNYGDVLRQAGFNHALADNSASIATSPPPEPPPAPVVSPGCTPASPPSAGGPGNGLVDGALGLADQVGIPVPDGDTGKLEAAASAWVGVGQASQLIDAISHLNNAAVSFADVTSPEVAIIDDDLLELKGSVEAIREAADELAASCREYRSNLDELRTELKGILEDLAVELAVTAAIAVAASFVTFGLAAAAGSAKAAHTVSKFARIIANAVTAWNLSKRISHGVKTSKDLSRLRQVMQRIRQLGKKGADGAPSSSSAVRTIEVKPLNVSRSQIEAKFKHADEFGVTEPRGKAGFDEFERVVKGHVDDASTKHIDGTYRGNPAILNYNPNNGLVVVQSPTGEFISGWKVSPAQAANILNSGKLGGG